MIKKILSFFLLITFTLQLISTSSAFAAKAAESLPRVEEESPKDLEYEDRSRRGEKWVFSDIPRHLGMDIKDTFWGWGSLIIALGAGATAGLYSQDHKIQNSFQPHAMFGNTGDNVLNYMGAPYTMAGIGIVITSVGAGTHNLKLRTTGEAVLESLFWSELFTIGMKYAFNRTRPDGSGHGFPSAHATGVFSTATVLQMMYGPKAGVPAYALAALVSLSRVDAYKHFPSDVLMGAVLGSAFAYGTTRYHKQLHHNFVLTPTFAPDTYGFNINGAF